MLSDLNRDKMYELLEQMGIPYIKVEIYKDQRERDESPIGSLADTFEMLVNSLLGDILITGSEDSGYFMTHLEYELQNLIMLAGCIMNNTENTKRVAEKLKLLHEQHMTESKKNGTKIPDVWLNAFKEEGDPKDVENG